MSDECSKVFFPLRSNAAWFRDSIVRDKLENRIKVNLLLYDRVLVEDGSYVVMAGVDGLQGLEQTIPPGTSNIDRTKSIYIEEGGRFEFRTGSNTLLSAEAWRGYHVDFMPILAQRNLVNVGFVELSRPRLQPGTLDEISVRSIAEQIQQQCADSLPENRYLAKVIVNGLLRDSTLAYFMNVPISVDEHAINVIRKQQSLVASDWSDALPEHFLDFWLDLDLPNFSEWSWDQVVEVRESEIGRDFRRMLHRVCQTARQALEEGARNRDIRDAISTVWAKELIDELRSRRATHFGTIASIAMNVVPFGFIPSIAKDCLALGREQESWVSILFMNQPQKRTDFN